MTMQNTVTSAVPDWSGMSEELKPVRCGCGAKAVLRTYGEPETPYCIQCTSCGITTLGYATEAEAVEAWNRAMGERTAKAVKEDNICICDNCSGLILTPFASYKYCPECGAKLEWE